MNCFSPVFFSVNRKEVHVHITALAECSPSAFLNKERQTMNVRRTFGDRSSVLPPYLPGRLSLNVRRVPSWKVRSQTTNVRPTNVRRVPAWRIAFLMHVTRLAPLSHTRRLETLGDTWRSSLWVDTPRPYVYYSNPTPQTSDGMSNPAKKCAVIYV